MSSRSLWDALRSHASTTSQGSYSSASSDWPFSTQSYWWYFEAEHTYPHRQTTKMVNTEKHAALSREVCFRGECVIIHSCIQHAHIVVLVLLLVKCSREGPRSEGFSRYGFLFREHHLVYGNTVQYSHLYLGCVWSWLGLACALSITDIISTITISWIKSAFQTPFQNLFVIWFLLFV